MTAETTPHLTPVLRNKITERARHDDEVVNRPGDRITLRRAIARALAAEGVVATPRAWAHMVRDLVDEIGGVTASRMVERLLPLGSHDGYDELATVLRGLEAKVTDLRHKYLQVSIEPHDLRAIEADLIDAVLSAFTATYHVGGSA